MEQTFVHLARDAAWVMLVILVLAFIGLVAIVRWIAGLFHRTEAAVESGVQAVEQNLPH